MTRSAFARAARTRLRCPSWRAPMVGTAATFKPCRRHAATTLRSSATVRTIGMHMLHLLLSGIRLVAKDVLCRWKAALANIVRVGRDCRGSRLAELGISLDEF